jgi:uncharacterized membrane protein YfhO
MKSDSERQRSHDFPHMWEIDTTQIQGILCKTGYTKGSSLMKGGKKKEIKKVNMADVLSIQERM